MMSLESVNPCPYFINKRKRMYFLLAHVICNRFNSTVIFVSVLLPCCTTHTGETAWHKSGIISMFSQMTICTHTHTHAGISCSESEMKLCLSVNFCGCVDREPVQALAEWKPRYLWMWTAPLVLDMLSEQPDTQLVTVALSNSRCGPVWRKQIFTLQAPPHRDQLSFIYMCL